MIGRWAKWLYEETFNTSEAKRRDFERRRNQTPL
jgi:hypothetical protein